MICSKCSKELPQGSQFCPYCLHKFTPETEIIPDAVKRKDNKKYYLMIAAVIILSVLIIAAVMLRSKKPGADPEDHLNTTESAGQQISETEKAEITEGTYSVTDENGPVQYPPATYVVVVEDDGSVKEGYLLPE